MEALYTMTLRDYLELQDDDYLTQIFADFPDYVFGETAIRFEDIFRVRFGLQEIGSETPERFDAELRRLAQTVYIDLAPVLDAYLANIEKLTDRSVEDTDTTTTYDYINPMNAEAVDDGSARLAGSQKIKYEKRYFVNSKTPAEMLKEISDLYHIYSDGVERFAVLFMGVW